MAVLIDFRSAVSRLSKLKKRGDKKRPMLTCVKKEECPHNRALERALDKIADALIELAHTSTGFLLFPLGASLLF